MKKSFYRIPSEIIDRMYDHALHMDRTNGTDYVTFLKSHIGDRKRFFIEESNEGWSDFLKHLPDRTANNTKPEDDPNQTVNVYEDEPDDEIETMNHGQAAELDADAECGAVDAIKREADRQEADRLTRELTAFENFQQLLDAKGGYRPSLAVSLDQNTMRLADLYDNAQEKRGDSRRAVRY